MNDKQIQGSLGATEDAVTLNVSGLASLTLQVTKPSAFSGTIAFEGTVDGTNWFSVLGNPVPSGSGVTTATDAGVWLFNVAGLTQFRVRCSAYTSGGLNANMRAVESGGASGSGGGGGAVTVADGANVALGTTTDAAQTDATQTGTIVAFLKGVVKVLADVWNSTDNYLKVSLATLISGEDLTNNVLGMIFKPTSSSSYAPSSKWSLNATTDSVKTSAGILFAVHARNENASPRYLMVFNKASAPAAADTPVITKMIPAGSGGATGSTSIGPDELSIFGKYLSTGIAIGVSDGADTFSAGATASEHAIHTTYV